MTVRIQRLALDDAVLLKELPLVGDRQYMRSTLTPDEVRRNT